VKRETLQKIVRFLMNKLTDLEFIDTHFIPDTGPVIIATNHLSRLDIPVLFLIPNRPDITALVADKYLRYPLFYWFTRTAGGIWIDRSKADFTAFKSAFDVLKMGKALGISPEGTRSTVGSLLEGKSGTALIASKMNVPVVPVGILGTEGATTKALTFRHPRIVARFGPALTIPPLDRDKREDQLKIYTDEIMCRIAALLPENYRGFYADYPRVQELLAEWSDRSSSPSSEVRGKAHTQNVAA
jgi:1-acyl-sn-glycerol-3-phosphate acyltransferase